MAELNTIDDIINAAASRPFRPNVYLSPESDSLNVCFSDEADFSERLTEHVTIFRSIDTRKLTGCRIKNIGWILESIPNFIDINHDGISLRLVFLALSSEAMASGKTDAFKELAEEAKKSDFIIPRHKELAGNC
jgi:hypothetical protein